MVEIMAEHSDLVKGKSQSVDTIPVTQGPSPLSEKIVPSTAPN